MKTLFHKYLILILLLTTTLSSISGYGQVTRIRGSVIDKTTNEIIPFVNIAFKNTTIGTITGFDGAFFLETRHPSDSLIVSYIGYKTAKIKVRKGAFQELKIILEPESIQMKEVVIKPGENPAHPILRKIIANKSRNDPDRFDSYQYEIYNKMEMDINNVTEEYKSKKAFKQFQFIFDYVDTSAVTGKTFLPVFIVESLSNFYYQKNPEKKKEEIKANKISGVDNDMISDFTGQMYLDFNIYNNFVPIMRHEVVSPISRFGLLYYKYYLIDSTYRGNSWCYHITFKPRRKQESTFTGDFWVHDTIFALESFKISIAKDMNINFVEHFIAEQSYTKVNDSTWFPKKQELFIDFVVTNKEYGFFGRKTTSYNNIRLNPVFNESFFSGQLSQETILLDNASRFSMNDWDTLRPETLTKRESDIYKMVDSIQEVPLYNSIVNLINTFVTGYWTKGLIEIGPYYTLYSFNPIEGSRFKFGAQTSNKVSTKIQIGGHIAYGTRDQKFKWGAHALYIFNKNPRRSAGINYKNDYEQLGVSSYAFLSDNILSSIFAREQNDKLTKVNDISVFYEHEWFQGISNTITFGNKMVYSSPTVPFAYVDGNMDTVYHNSLNTTEIKLNTRIAYNEKFILGEFNRMSLGTTYPVININLSAGLQGVFDSDYEYYKININLEDKIRVNPLGMFRYNIDIGKIFGDAPYPFLQLHEGNQTYAFDDYAFNLMNYYEFVSNEYVSIMLENHFMGTFLNHVPLFRKLKWREVAHFKILMGDITQRDLNYIAFPENLEDLNDPYMEAGIGVENIFKFFRIDAIWRLSYLDNPDVLPFGIFAKMQVRF